MGKRGMAMRGGRCWEGEGSTIAREHWDRRVDYRFHAKRLGASDMVILLKRSFGWTRAK